MRQSMIKTGWTGMGHDNHGLRLLLVSSCACGVRHIVCLRASVYLRLCQHQIFTPRSVPVAPVSAMSDWSARLAGQVSGWRSVTYRHLLHRYPPPLAVCRNREL
jgi:hypothetical protein